MDRRSFGKGAAVAGLATALGQRRVQGAGDRIGVGIIGCGGKGQSLWKNFLAQPNVDPVAVADVYAPFRDKGKELSGGRARSYSDFRKLLDDKDVQAVIVATPDHWHALMTVAACRAGKDVYVEKPLSLFVREGRNMLDEARKHKRVVQTGSQQRSGAHYIKAVQLIREGAHRPGPQGHRGLHPQRAARLQAQGPAGQTTATWTGTCGWGRRPRWPSIRSAASTISAGSGTTAAGR